MGMQFLRAAVLLIFFGLAGPARGEVIEAKIYPLDSNKQNPIFEFRHEITEEGAQAISQTIYRNMEGAPAVEEKTVVQDGRIQSYEITQHQENQVGRILVQGEELVFSVTQSGKAQRGASEKLPKDFLVGPWIGRYLAKNWDSLQKGASLPVRLGVWFRKETVGFEFTKHKDLSFEGREATQVKMSPSNFIIAALVDPIYFTLDKKSHRLLKTRGRLPVKRKKGDSYEDLDAEVYYTYPEAAPPVAVEATKVK